MVDDVPCSRGPAKLSRPPVADYDHMTVRGVERRLVTLDQDEVEALVRYESAHENRTPVMRLLIARLHQLREAGRSVPGRPEASTGGYGPAPATSQPGHSIPGLPAAGAPDPTPLPPPGHHEPDS